MVIIFFSDFVENIWSGKVIIFFSDRVEILFGNSYHILLRLC